MDKILKCYHSNESSSAVGSHGTVCFQLFCKMKFLLAFVELSFWPLLGVIIVNTFVPDGVSPDGVVGFCVLIGISVGFSVTFSVGFLVSGFAVLGLIVGDGVL